MDRIIIIDGNSLINRAYYAMARPMITREGIYTQGIYGFLNMLSKIEEDYEPTHMAVAWDLKAPTFRHKEYDAYKAGRKTMPAELAMELPIMKDILEAKGIRNLSVEGFEADDVIGTVSKMADDAGMDTMIITGDKDALQLASDTVKVIITKKGITEFELYDAGKMKERYQLTPSQFVDLKGLMGDSSDNIPGIPGVGEKTGIKLLTQFGSISNMLAHTDEISNKKLKEKVEENAQLALMSRRLAEIVRNVPVGVTLDELKIGETDTARLIDIYRKLEFKSFLKKLHIEGSETKRFSEENSAEILYIDSSEGIEALSRAEAGAEAVVKTVSDHSHIGKPEISAVGILIGDRYYHVDVTAEGVLESLVNLLNDKRFRMSGHDLVKEYYDLMWNGFEAVNTDFDTAVAQYVLDPSRSGYDLKSLATEYLHYEIADEKEALKDLGQMDILGENGKKLAEFCMEQCIAIRRVRAVQEEEIGEKGLENVFTKAELPLIEVLAAMERQGFTVDRETLAEQGRLLTGRINRITDEIFSLAGEEFNINSPVQLGEILFEKLGLPAGKKTKRGYSTSADILEKIRDKHPIVDMVLQYRTLSKLKSTYVDGLIPLIGADGRIRAHFRQTVTATGRISCTEPNLQNIPIRHEEGRLLRKAFTPSKDNRILVGADYSQIELRVLAHLSGDENLIEAFNRGDDIHRNTAARVFGLKYEDVTPLDRSRAKAVNFGVIYGMSGFGLSEELSITRKEAEKYIADYFSKHEAVKKYMDEQVRLCRERGFTETILGRRRYIHEINSSNYMTRQLGERLAMNSPIQGSAADIIKLAMIKVYRELKEKNMRSKLILQVHDELIIDTALEELEDVKELLIRNMTGAMDLKVKLESDLNMGKTWYDLK